MSRFAALFRGADPIAGKLREFQALAEEEGIPIRVTETRRSVERQRKLYAQGRTEPGPIVTWTLNTQHTAGRAFDCTIVGAPEYEDDPEAWEILGELGLSLGLAWGGSYADYGHFELPR